jgi:hypothetical protein
LKHRTNKGKSGALIINFTLFLVVIIQQLKWTRINGTDQKAEGRRKKAKVLKSFKKYKPVTSKSWQPVASS